MWGTIFTGRNEVCGQGNVFTGVCLSTGGRVSASVHAGMPTPPDQADPPGTRWNPPWTRQTPPGPGGPPDQADPPRTRQTPPRPGRTPPGPSRHPLSGPGRPPGTRQTPRDQADPPGTRQTPPGPGRPPLDQADPPGSRLQHTVYYERPVRILLECILVFIKATPVEHNRVYGFSNFEVFWLVTTA